MDSTLINPFINSTIHAISTMCSCTPVAGQPVLKQGKQTWGDVTGIIGLAGSSVMGNMMLSFDKAGALFVVSKLLMEEITELNQEVIDAVGEITNIITGGAKKELADLGLVIEMATPMVLSGKGVEINQLAAAATITIPFSLGTGSFVVEASIARR